MRKPVPTLYLFNNIFYPQTVIPLTVSDTVSKEMMLACFEHNVEVALYHPHPRSKGIGTLGKILLIDTNKDGSLSVMVQGLIRIKLLHLEVQEPFPQYRIEDYSDIEERSQTLMDSPLERLHTVLDHWLTRHVHSKKERERFMKDMSSPGKLINNLCMLLIKDIELKQIFLENTSLLDRVRMMNALLIGDTPETEDLGMCEAIKNFERLEIDEYKNAS
jgi:Lon protease-like protein